MNYDHVQISLTFFLHTKAQIPEKVCAKIFPEKEENRNTLHNHQHQVYDVLTKAKPLKYFKSLGCTALAKVNYAFSVYNLCRYVFSFCQQHVLKISI